MHGAISCATCTQCSVAADAAPASAAATSSTASADDGDLELIVSACKRIRRRTTHTGDGRGAQTRSTYVVYICSFDDDRPC